MARYARCASLGSWGVQRYLGVSIEVKNGVRLFGLYRTVGHRLVAGWLAPEVLDVLVTLDSAQRSTGVSGAVAEIGVHHGRLFIGLQLLQGVENTSVAIDLFDQQTLNVDKSGKGNIGAFQRNVNRWSSAENLVIHQGDSTRLTSDELVSMAGDEIRLFSIDGGHTDSIVFSDMTLAESTVATGGIVIADDVFNQEWPGVSTGTFRYLTHGGRLAPFAIGFNKVFFTHPEFAPHYLKSLEDEFQHR